ncbi:family 20 glycosylhydrolase [bacterium]|nr:family 20 glycosylhydrolase [bacterium]
MRRTVVWMTLLFSGVPMLTPGKNSVTPDWMPVPAEVRMHTDRFSLDSSFAVSIEGAATDRLSRACVRLMRRVSDRTGLFFQRESATGALPLSAPGMTVAAQREGRVSLGEDESYSLEISAQGIRLSAVTDIGCLRGMETLFQLLDADADPEGSGYGFPCLTVRDKPRFPWRGLLIDVSRHFMPADVILRNLDGMAAVKLNVLHWHLSDDQGFRVETRSFPKLHGLGSDGFYYSQEEIRGIIAYAADRGIRVVPEFDMPGHVTSWLAGYPELTHRPGPFRIERRWGVWSSAMDPTRKSTYRFLERFIAEMTGLFPDEYFHIGGDEVEGKPWMEDPDIRAYMKKHGLPDAAALQTHFTLRVQKILASHDRKMIGWDEILTPGLQSGAVIQSWRGRESLVEAVSRGMSAILSNGYYIDLVQPAAFHYSNDPLTPDMNLSEAEAANVLGGEATMWAELVTPETVDSRIWPRTAAIAERLWSPADIRDPEDMHRRLRSVSLMLEQAGLTHIRNRGVMMRRLAAGTDTGPLEILLSAVEPVKNYRRHSMRPFTTFSPLTCVADASVPDAEKARRFNTLVESLLSGAGGSSEAEPVRRQLILWRDNHEAMLPLIRRSPILAEIESLSEDLSRAAEIGLQALDFRASGRTPESVWTNEVRTRLESMAEPRAEVELVILDAIRKLASQQ